jgi:hypothetical protein
VVMVSVELPEPLTEAGLNVAIAPEGSGLTLKATVPVKPPDGVTVAVYEAFKPAVTVWELGEAEREKSGEGAPSWTTNVATAIRCNLPVVPLVAVIVSGKVPAGVKLLVTTVNVVVPEPLMIGGLKVLVVPGRPLTLKFTGPAKPPEGVTVTE